ncbi:hypothetical protein M413DRAFT_444582 [Hebeloma cylindrosporum]|uniref:Uncharacterized protein n=1 Tax=Hebeloma cylindrosporum TaxID=76867 RepID=A0A0C3CEU9_HEBCY|nr:hypothetical protein M413DRAFT_444582 [Hebeloma cylindrosporum h7]
MFPDTEWHAIRPWAPTLSLSVREITSVSATFLLSSSFTGDFDSSLASIGLEAAAVADDDPENGQDEAASSSMPGKPNSVIADALAQGLSVNVNGSPWPRAFVRIDDQLDEAVIIIYALMPGRQYDIELGLAPAGQPTSTVRRQVTTDGRCGSTYGPRITHPDNSTSSSDPHSTPSTSPSRTVPGTPPNATPQITLEDRLSQLQHTLSAVNSERETLLSSLKSARREAQKADRHSRTSERNAAAELKGKQKVLALQEAVKRAQNAAKDTEALSAEVEANMPELNERKQKKEDEHSKIKSEADKARKEREDVEEKERKREKLESTVIPDLEEKLKDMEKEIEVEESGLARLEMEETFALSQAHIVEAASPSFSRPRYHSAGERPSPIGRPPPSLIQRPDLSGSSPNGSINVSSGGPLWSPTHVHRQQSHGQTSQTHNPRSHSYHNHNTPILLMHPQQQRRGSLKANITSSASTPNALSSLTTLTSSPTANSSPTSSSPTRTTASSTLSSRAPVFEPSKSVMAASHSGGQSQFHGIASNSTNTSPVAAIQRPIGTNGVSAVGAGRSHSQSGNAKNGSVGVAQWPAMHAHGHGHGHGHRDTHVAYDASR